MPEPIQNKILNVQYCEGVQCSLWPVTDCGPEWTHLTISVDLISYSSFISLSGAFNADGRGKRCIGKRQTRDGTLGSVGRHPGVGAFIFPWASQLSCHTRETFAGNIWCFLNLGSHHVLMVSFHVLFNFYIKQRFLSNIPQPVSTPPQLQAVSFSRLIQILAAESTECVSVLMMK